MKFKCGLTREEKLSIEKQKLEKECIHLSTWRKHFTLLPRTISIKNGMKTCVWLETIEKRWINPEVVWDDLFGNYFIGYDGVEYREIT